MPSTYQVLHGYLLDEEIITEYLKMKEPKKVKNLFYIYPVMNEIEWANRILCISECPGRSFEKETHQKIIIYFNSTFVQKKALLTHENAF